MTIYSNTTPLLAFSAIGRLDLINKVHGEICIVPSVVAECGVGGVVEVLVSRGLGAALGSGCG